MTGINIGDLPSWQTVILIGAGLWWASSNELLDRSYSFGDGILQVEGLGSTLVVIGVLLGAIYFAMDLSNKM